MKKTYIEPKTRIIAADVRDDIMLSGSTGGEKLFEDGGNTGTSGIVDGDSRETISAPDAWEEW